MSNISLDDIEYDDADADVTELRSPNMRQMMELFMKQQEEIKQMREQLNVVTNKLIEENKKKEAAGTTEAASVSKPGESEDQQKQSEQGAKNSTLFIFVFYLFIYSNKIIYSYA